MRILALLLPELSGRKLGPRRRVPEEGPAARGLRWKGCCLSCEERLREGRKALRFFFLKPPLRRPRNIILIINPSLSLLPALVQLSRALALLLLQLLLLLSLGGVACCGDEEAKEKEGKKKLMQRRRQQKKRKKIEGRREENSCSTPGLVLRKCC